MIAAALEAYAGVGRGVSARVPCRARLVADSRGAAAVAFPAGARVWPERGGGSIYQELFILQLALAVKRHCQHDKAEAPPLEPTAKIDARIRRLFPFEFTAGQEQAIADVKADLARPIR